MRRGACAWPNAEASLQSVGFELVAAEGHTGLGIAVRSDSTYRFAGDLARQASNDLRHVDVDLRHTKLQAVALRRCRGGGDGVRRWSRSVRRQLTAARDLALAGQPTVLLLEGEPGIGKSSLLDLLIVEAIGFRVLTADGYDSMVAAPYGVLNQWGAVTSDVGSPVLAAQRLRETLDERPTLLVLDDLQWCDQESVAALLAVLARVEGDHLLVAIATRPLPPTAHPAWQRWCARSDRVRRVQLAGLDLDSALAVIRERQPRIDLTTARALWEHTAGNPLHLIALTAEYEPGELARARVLPAPSAFAGAIVATLARLPTDAIAAARAIAVVGDQWSPLPVVAELAELAELSVPAQQLVDAEAGPASSRCCRAGGADSTCTDSGCDLSAHAAASPSRVACTGGPDCDRPSCGA